MVLDDGLAGEREERLREVEGERAEARALLRPRDQDHCLHRRHLHLRAARIGRTRSQSLQQSNSCSCFLPSVFVVTFRADVADETLRLRGFRCNSLVLVI